MALEIRGPMWWYRFVARGREYRRSTGLAATQQERKNAEAVEARAKLEAIAGTETPKAGRAVSFAAAADDFLAWCYSTEYRDKPNTARRIQISFQSLVFFMGDRSVQSIDQNAIEDYKTLRLTQHGVKPVTLRHDLHALSVFFRKYAIRKRLAESNPVKAVTIPSDKDARRIYVVSRAEEAAYFASARGTLRDVARLILEQGCRPDEILSLRPGDVDVERAVLTIRGGKTPAARRELPLTAESLRVLQKRLESHGGAPWLFPSSRIDGHVTKLNAQHDRTCRDAGVSFCLYDLRHTFATRQITEAGTDVATLAALLGHSKPHIVLEFYVHTTAESKRRAMKNYEELNRPKLRRVK